MVTEFWLMVTKVWSVTTDVWTKARTKFKLIIQVKADGIQV
jgi:hypothetical protein